MTGAGPVAAAALAAAVLAAPSSVAVADLLGLTPAAVQARLGPGQPRLAPGGFVGRSGGRRLELTSAELASGSDAALACAWPRRPPSNGARWTPPTAALLIFRGGVMGRATALPPLRPLALPKSGPHGSPDPHAVMAWVRQPQDDPLVAVAGELPLQRGLDELLARLGPVPADARLATPCPVVAAPPSPAPAPAPVRGSILDALNDPGVWQGIGYAPFAAFQLPRLNAERARARVEGPRALAELTPGQLVPDGLDRFAATRFGVHVEPGADGYAILVIDLGAPASNNVSRMNRYAFAGVRRGVVEWVSRDGGPLNGEIAAGLCEDGDRRPSARRRGCTDVGFFSP